MEKKIIENTRQWKHPFKLGDMMTLYTGIKANSWAGKISDMWDGIYIVHQILDKGTYFIKPYQSAEPKLTNVCMVIDLSYIRCLMSSGINPSNEHLETIRDANLSNFKRLLKKIRKADAWCHVDKS